jgi:hypothetical protein
MNSDLAAAIKRACSPSSFYWAFLGVSRQDASEEREVEIRINAATETVSTLEQPPGWTLERRDASLGAVFLRRKQRLTRQAVRGLIRDAITLAHEAGGTFQSWAHEPF